MTTMNRAQRRAQQQIENDIRAVLAHPPTLRFICTVLETTGYHQDPTYIGDANMTFRNIGRQEAARDIVRRLTAVDETAMQRLLETAAQHRADTVAQHEDETHDAD